MIRLSLNVETSQIARDGALHVQRRHDMHKQRHLALHSLGCKLRLATFSLCATARTSLDVIIAATIWEVQRKSL